jgi:hypothetical protein
MVVDQLPSQEGKAKDTAERAAALEAARALQVELAGQVAMREAGEAREHDEEVAYFHEEQVGGLDERRCEGLNSACWGSSRSSSPSQPSAQYLGGDEVIPDAECCGICQKSTR